MKKKLKLDRERIRVLSRDMFPDVAGGIRTLKGSACSNCNTCDNCQVTDAYC